MALDAHIVSHTHWDREWYRPAERFRQRLVALVDELLDDPPDRDESFLLDGQTIVLDDYLAVRPDRADHLGVLLDEGRLEAGPWFVLGDELIPSGEALVRNLLAGWRALHRFDATAPGVLYCPDSFGHPAALPSIAAGFGLPVIVLWRGYGGPRWPRGDTVRWTAPNGDVALLYHLPRDGYEFGSHLPLDANDARVRWQRMRAELVPRATTGVALIPNGADHHARQIGFRDAIAALVSAAAADGDTAHPSTLRRFGQRLVDESAKHELPSVSGELRDSYGYTWTLQGTFATRAHEKRSNAHAERLMVREAEPWSALAARLGMSRRPLVEAAWRTLLTAQPHDTLCGCSIDEVASAMELRIRSAANQAVGIRDDAIAALIGHDSVAARAARDRWTPVVVVRNPAARPRSGVAVFDIEEWIADVPVGPGSAPAEGVQPTALRGTPRIPGLGPLQVLSRRRKYSLTESPRHYPDNDLVAVTRVAAWVTDAPPYGLVCHAIGGGPLRRPRVENFVVVGERTIKNGRLALSVSHDGVVSLEHIESGRQIPALLELIDESDIGDLYTPAPRPRAFTVRFRGVQRVNRGPFRGELALRYRIVDGARRPGVSAELTIRLILDADSPFVRVHIVGTNAAANHRLRLAIHAGVSNGETWADAAFGPIRRQEIVVGAAEAATEQPPPTAPLHRYVSQFGATAGATVFSDGLAEYESRRDGSIVVTLVRAVGELSRNDLPERPGHAGWPAPTPEAQCLGPFAAEFALMFHGSRTAATIDEIERMADDVLCPLAGATLRSALELPAPVTGVELVGSGLALSAVKDAERDDWLVLRCVNLCDETVFGEWRLPFDIREARLSRLDETPMTELETSGRTVPIVAAPRDIITILVR